MRYSAIRLKLIFIAVTITLLAVATAYGQTPSDFRTQAREHWSRRPADQLRW